MKYIPLPLQQERYDIRKLIDKRVLVCVMITVGLILLSVFYFKNSYYRLWQALQDLGQSIAYYFCELFVIPHNITPEVISFDFGLPGSNGTAPSLPPIFIPDNFDSYKAKLELYMLVFNMDNFKNYFSGVAGRLQLITTLSMLLIIPVVVAFKMYINRTFEHSNNRYGIDSRPLFIAKRTNDIVFRPAKNFVKAHFDFVCENKIYWLWLIIILLSLNVVSIITAFFAYYFYFAISMDISSLYSQFYKLFVDISPTFNYLGWWLWIPVLIIIYFKRRELKATGQLRLFDEINDRFLDKLKLAVFIVGSMGSGKTTLMCNLMIDVQRRHRRKALEMIHNYKTQFPNFPWSTFERILKCAIKDKKIYNLRSARKFVAIKNARFVNFPCPEKLYGYDYKKYGLIYDNKKEIVNLFDVLDKYARVFFLYFIASTLLISNISVRDDVVILDKGNFPLIDDDSLSRSSGDVELISSYSHIFDFDMFRLGQKMVVDNQFTGVLEFFSLGITEIAKERGNQNDLKEIKQHSEEANPKNDNFERSLNLMRHNATVDGECFAFLVFDDQRPGALSASLVNLATIVEISGVTARKNAMPKYWFFRTFHDVVYNSFTPKFDKYDFNRADTTLLKYLLFNIVSKIHRHNEEMYNKYGYKQVTLRIVDGLTGERSDDEYSYFYIFHKIYRNVFATDCYGSMLDTNTKLGIDDIPTYDSLYPTRPEFESQNSYFIEKIIKYNELNKKE